MRSRSTVAVFAVLLGVAASLAAGACTTSPRSAAPGVTVGAGADYSRPGPFAAGVTTLHLPRSTVDVWYPADAARVANRGRQSYDLTSWLPPSLAAAVPAGLGVVGTAAVRDAPAAHGRFPLVLFAHGSRSYRDQSTFLTESLASWGFVVASPEFPADDLTAYFDGLAAPDVTPAGAPDDQSVLSDTETLVVQQSETPGSVLSGTVAGGRVGMVGHSQGGLDAIEFAYRPEVAVYVTLAAGFSGAIPTLPDKPSLYMAASDDVLVRAPVVDATQAHAPAPTELVTLDHAGHLAFTDLCMVGTGRGGLEALAGAIAGGLGRPLPAGAPFVPPADNGCGSGYLSPEQGYARIRQAVVSRLASVLVPPR